MQILKDAVIINISPSQRRIFRDAKYSAHFEGLILDAHGSSRPHIPVSQIGNLVERLRRLQVELADDPEYQRRRPAKVIDQIILKIEDAGAAQRRAYPPEALKSN